MKKLTYSAICVALSLSLSGCLKSRLQIREDGSEETKPLQSQVQDVQPQGGYVIDEMKSEITRLSGRVEELERSAKANPAGGTAEKEEVKKMELRIVELEQAQAKMLEALAKLQDIKLTSEGPEIFQRAKIAYESGEYDSAIEGFSQYLKNPKADNIEEATFYRGEAYFKLKQYKKAIVDYSNFPEKFKRSRHMPAALLNIGLCFDALGMRDDAKAFYQELVSNFPRSPEAKRAKAKLK